ncbi:hypothetical protein NliqN6_5966 [Naganishia liquefaciens]|uniref:Mitochondrial glycine transporter n=1 Tax=Naganishia liquefaciens TaxID=104408 RepID=A0A8H3TYR1_9TREE|nr:hypothetical protein NliqN6_5966 [Naganishia liquefaciens]
MTRGDRPNKATHHLLSGATSGLASAVILQPLDLVKTRLQQGAGGDVKGKGRLGRVVRGIVKDEGVGALWRGTVPTVVRNVPGVAVYFYLLNEIRYTLSTTGYFAASPSSPASPSPPPPPTPAPPLLPSQPVAEAFPAPAPASTVPTDTSIPALPLPLRIPLLQTAEERRRKMSALPKLNSQGNLVAGAVARTSVGFVLNPFTVLKSRYESNLYPTYTSLPRAFTELVKTEGVRGLFQGFTATAARDAPYAGVYVVFYEEMKEVLGHLSSRLAPDAPTTGIHTLSGISAATLATLATSPADCVKTKMQLLPNENPTIRSAIRTIYLSRGLAGFFAGSTLRISRKAASSAIGWSVYEGLLLGLRDRKVLG